MMGSERSRLRAAVSFVTQPRLAGFSQLLAASSYIMNETNA